VPSPPVLVLGVEVSLLAFYVTFRSGHRWPFVIRPLIWTPEGIWTLILVRYARGDGHRRGCVSSLG